MNATWMKTKIVVGRFFCYLYLLLLYRWWSRLYRLIWEHKYSTVALQSYRNFTDLVAIMRTCVWTADGWKQIWDAFSYPGKVQFIINTDGPKPKIGDCDEFAIYLANVLEQSSTLGGHENGRFVLDTYEGMMVERARVLTVSWVKQDGKYGGHNVCLIDFFDLKSKHHPLTGPDYYAFMDYDYPNVMQVDLRGVIEQVMNKYAPGGTCIAWAIHDKDLKLEKVGAHAYCA